MNFTEEEFKILKKALTHYPTNEAKKLLEKIETYLHWINHTITGGLAGGESSIRK